MHINYYDVYGKEVRMKCQAVHIPRKKEVVKLPPDNGAWEVTEIEYVYSHPSKSDINHLRYINIFLSEDTKGF